MRRYRMRFDVWLSFLLACGIAYLVGLGVDKITERTYEGYRESRLVEDGVVGGAATEDIYRITCIDDIKSHELFTLETEGIDYRNEGGGYFETRFLYSVELPSGERVAMWINNENVVSDGDYFTGINTLPVGRIVEADLAADESFMNQINHDGSRPLTATDFYVDMVGEGGYVSEDSYRAPGRRSSRPALCFVSYIISARVSGYSPISSCRSVCATGRTSGIKQGSIGG